MARPVPTPLGSELLVSKGTQPAAALAPEQAPLVQEQEPALPAQDTTAKRVMASNSVPSLPAPKKSALAPKARVVRVPLTVKISPETLKRLRVVAVHLEIEQQDIVEEALRNWLEVNES